MKHQLFAVILILILGYSRGVPSCPSGCNCTTDILLCADIRLSLTQDSVPNPTTIKNAIFQRCDIPNIAANTFSAVSNISSVLFLNSLLGTVRGNAFNGMTGADPEFLRAGENETGILFSNVSIATIEADAFKGLIQIQYVLIGPAEVTTIKSGAFAATAIDKIAFIYSSIATLESRAFDAGLTTNAVSFTVVGLPAQISSYAFAGIKDSKLIIEHCKLGTIQANALAMTNVSITLTNSALSRISKNAFNGARNIIHVMFGKLLLEEIESEIFGDMTGNPEIRQSMDNDVVFTEMALKRVRGRAFAGLSGFSNFMYKKNLVDCVEKDAFEGIEVPTEITENLHGKTVDDCPSKASQTNYSVLLAGIIILLLELINFV